MAAIDFKAFEFVRVEDRGSVRLVIINRPTKANALNRRTLSELQMVVDATAAEEAIRFFALTGAGQKVFSAGADLSETSCETSSSEVAKAYDRRWNELSGSIASLPCVTAALLNGACIGGGLSLALAFDFRIVASHAYFRYPAAKHGFIPSPADVERLLALAGVAWTRKLLLLGETISASNALLSGLAHAPLGEQEIWSEVGRLSSLIRAGQTRSQLAIKSLIAAAGNSILVEEDCYRAVYDFDEAALKNLRRNISKLPSLGYAPKLPRSAEDADA